MGLAFLLLAFIPGPKSEALNLIWGSILTISRKEIWLLAIIFFLTLALIITFFKELSAVLFDREVAASSGIPDNIFYYSIIFFAGLIISGSLNIVGLSASFGIISCLAGLIFSYLFNVPTGAVIVLASSCIFLLAFMLSPKRRIAKSL